MVVVKPGYGIGKPFVGGGQHYGFRPLARIFSPSFLLNSVAYKHTFPLLVIPLPV